MITWLGQVSANSITDDAGFGFKPQDTGLQAVTFQAQEGAQGKPNVVALSDGPPMLGLLNPTKLLEPSMILFNVPDLRDVSGELVKID